ncbi:hypothetical protein PENANT_c016G00982 [Penicillium antarcticum]|uniref:Helicase C-terminal domain-containing protein n=1 Tax=Penicillium antarcticum TaxID=416450 RepID=A0A1V6Q2L4_9EURO|nr:hypothetical protein PENANT_c016G00982 [Penicillium antarcticum]
MLDLIAVALRENGFEFERIDGQTPLERRLLALKTLHDDPKCTVMLASIGSIAEGVDLTAASRVHIIEPQWNPMVEAQALDRVHRMGQTRDVVTTRYIVKDSIETYVQDIQQAKLKLALEPFGKVSAQTIAKENRLQNLQKALV